MLFTEYGTPKGKEGKPCIQVHLSTVADLVDDLQIVGRARQWERQGAGNQG